MIRHLSRVAVAVVLITGCSGGGSSKNPSTPAPPAPTLSRPYTLAECDVSTVNGATPSKPDRAAFRTSLAEHASTALPGDRFQVYEVGTQTFRVALAGTPFIDVAALCRFDGLVLRPLIIPGVAAGCGGAVACSTRPPELSTLPHTAGDYARLSADRRHAITDLLAHFNCVSPPLNPGPGADLVACGLPVSPQRVYLLGPAIASGRDALSATAGPTSVLAVQLSASGATAWAKYRSAHGTRTSVAVLVDGTVQSVPNQPPSVSNGTARFSADWGHSRVERLAAVITAAAHGLQVAGGSIKVVP